jgi:hypothetical protein
VSDGPAPAPGSPEERAADRRALKAMLVWFGVCALLGALYLVLAIYVDWI